jgi:hypothetical protein
MGLVFALTATPLFAMEDQDPALVLAQGTEPCQEEVPVEGQEEPFRLDCTSTFAEGLAITALGALPEEESAYRAYVVEFTEAGAYIPERFSSQAMVVTVLEGGFAFRPQGPGVIVDTHGQPLEKYTATAPIGFGDDPETAGGTRSYNVTGEFPCTLNPAGQVLCQLNPADFAAGDVFVRLEPNDTVYLPDDSTCFVCNTETIVPGAPVELLIWAPATAFNGDLESAASYAMAPQQDQPHSALAWRRNPGSNCN